MRYSSICALALLATACATEPEELILTVKLSVDAPTGGHPIEGELRAAVVWSVVDPWPDEPQLSIGSSVHVSQRFPNVTELNVFDTLPDQVLTDERKAVGTVLLFDDRDGDDALRLTSARAGEFRDRVVGWAPDLRIDYDDGRATTGFDERFAAPAVVLSAPGAACFGLETTPLSYPRDALDELRDPDDPFAIPARPVFVQVPPCPDNAIPDDWWRVRCGGGGTYVVDVLERPTSERIANQCGWLVHLCRVTPPTPAPPEFPSCG